MIGIYKILSPSGKVYIGQSVNINKRWRTYLNGHIKNQRKLKNSFDKYGVDNHIFEVLCECSNDNLNELEVYYSELYNSTSSNGLNIRQCGGAKSKLSEETKRLISSSNMGRIVTSDCKRKISEKLKGNVPWNKGVKTGQSSWNKGLKLSEETKSKLSKLYKGKFGNDSKSAKIIIQYDLSGNFIKRWSGAREVERHTGFKCAVINRCSRGERATAYNFKWMYE
jgi:group I intron endonuclease